MIPLVRKLEQANSGSDWMKQIFRDLKNDNKNKIITHQIYVKIQCGKKSRTAMSTINPLYEQGEYKVLATTTSDWI